MTLKSTLTELQHERKQSTHDSVLEAMNEIEVEIARDGYYSENEGKVTQAEVLRRAGVGSSTLRNSHHHDLREEVKDWIAKLAEGAPVTKGGSRTAARRKIAQYELAMRQMSSAVVVLRHEKAENARENAVLRSAVDKVRKQLRDVARQDPTNVIIFPEPS